MSETPRTDACTAHFWATVDDYDIKADAIDNHIEELTALSKQLEQKNAELRKDKERPAMSKTPRSKTPRTDAARVEAWIDYGLNVNAPMQLYIEPDPKGSLVYADDMAKLEQENAELKREVKNIKDFMSDDVPELNTANYSPEELEALNDGACQVFERLGKLLSSTTPQEDNNE